MAARPWKNPVRWQTGDLLLLTGIVVAYVAFFIYPVFLNAERTLKYLPYIVKIDPFGLDLAQMLDYSRAWLLRQQSPYIGANMYPPLAVVVFAPLLFVEAATAYHLMTLLNLVCYAICVLVAPALLNPRPERTRLVWLVFISGLSSYGLHFELERGQFNLLAYACCLLALDLFHRHARAHLAAYLLFCLAVQLKIYPAIFVVLFVRDWRAWRENWIRCGGLLLANIALCGVLGMDIFYDFCAALVREAGSNLWIGNHSIRAFVLLSPFPFKTCGEIVLFVFVCGCLGVLIAQAYRRRLTGFQPPLLLAGTIAALLIPSVSNDYTLTLLTAAVAIAFPRELPPAPTRVGRWLAGGLLAMIACAYASTLYSFTNKPWLLRHNLPALLTILCAWTAYVWLFTKSSADIPVCVSPSDCQTGMSGLPGATDIPVCVSPSDCQAGMSGLPGI